MSAKLTLDKRGRIVLPKPVRDKLRFAAGDQLELESVDDRIIVGIEWRLLAAWADQRV
jgi:AbrB family looped-hinge helix DNA binding protein